MLDLNFNKAKSLVEESIASRGEDYVYQKNGNSCAYVHNIGDVWDAENERFEDDFSSATPGCLVGDALKRGGIPLETMGGDVNTEGSDSLLTLLSWRRHLTYTEKASLYLNNLQTSQDNGATWGESH
jgi:hypothetical protein